MKKCIVLILVLAASLCSIASDVNVQLKSGSIITGSLVLQNSEIVVIQTASGARFQLPASEVVQISAADEPMQQPKVAEPAPVQRPVQNPQANAGYNDPYAPATPSSRDVSKMIIRQDGSYSYNGHYIDIKEVEKIIAGNVRAHNMWEKASKEMLAGAILLGCGIGMGIGGLAALSVSPPATIGLGCVGGALSVTGAVLLGVGASHRNRSIEIYNYGFSDTVSLSIINGYDGIGVAVKF